MGEVVDIEEYVLFHFTKFTVVKCKTETPSDGFSSRSESGDETRISGSEPGMGLPHKPATNWIGEKALFQKQTGFSIFGIGDFPLPSGK